MPGHLFLHLKLLYDGCKGVRDDQDHDPNAWDSDLYAKKDDGNVDENDAEKNLQSPHVRTSPAEAGDEPLKKYLKLDLNTKLLFHNHKEKL